MLRNTLEIVIDATVPLVDEWVEGWIRKQLVLDSYDSPNRTSKAWNSPGYPWWRNAPDPPPLAPPNQAAQPAASAQADPQTTAGSDIVPSPMPEFGALCSSVPRVTGDSTGACTERVPGRRPG